MSPRTAHPHTKPQAERARTLNIVRRIGYRILPGDVFSYILHLRPREWPIMLAHTGLGFLLAVGIDPAAVGSSWGDAFLGIGLWVVFLNGGTLAINSAFDDDEDDVGYLDAPPPPPRHLAVFSIAFMSIGQILAFQLPTAYTAVYAVCFVMSVLYSVPPARLKAVAGADWIINMWGFGTLTPVAGWVLTGRPVELWAALVFLAFCPLFAAFYPLTQIYQFEEDRARGDRTLAIALGMRRSLGIATLAAALAFVTFGAAIALGPANRLWPTFTLPLIAWAAVLIPWLLKHESMTTAQHKRGMYAALHAWAITDIVVIAVFGF